MTPPIIVDAREELLFFRDQRSAETYVEAIDVTNGEYGHCWDAEGRLLILAVETPGRWLSSERVILRQSEETPSHQRELTDALCKYLAEAHSHSGDAALLAELVAAAVAKGGYA